jgi:tetratricopeptide (TPR) repeat protein
MDNIHELKQRLEDCQDGAERAELLISLASGAWQTGEYSEGKTFAEAALELCIARHDEPGQACATHILGTIYSYLDAYDLALEHYLKAQRLNARFGAIEREAEAWNGMGDIYIKLGNVPKARECFETSHRLYPDYERSVNNLGFLKMLDQDLSEAIRYYRLAGEIAARKNNRRSLVISHINIADALCKQNNPGDAMAELETACEILDGGSVETPNELKCALHLNIAVVQQDLDRDTEALQNLKDALHIAEQAQLRDYQQKSLFILSEFYQRHRKWQKAFDYLKQYTAINAELLSSSTLEKAASIQNFYTKETRDLTTLNLSEKSARLATMGILSTGITHELNQPLSAIRISTESILYWLKRESIVLPMNFNVELDHIMEGIKRIEAFVRQIRQFWNSGKSGEPSCCDLSLVIDKCLSLVSRRVFAHGIQMQLEEAPSLPGIMATEIHLQQIVINLLNHNLNILEAGTNRHKSLLIKTGAAEEGVCLSVMQNCKEITPQMTAQLYNPLGFECAAVTPEMDMAIVKYLCDHYHYKIRVADQDDEYWGFSLCLGACR